MIIIDKKYCQEMAFFIFALIHAQVVLNNYDNILKYHNEFMTIMEFNDATYYAKSDELEMSALKESIKKAPHCLMSRVFTILEKTDLSFSSMENAFLANKFDNMGLIIDSYEVDLAIKWETASFISNKKLAEILDPVVVISDEEAHRFEDLLPLQKIIIKKTPFPFFQRNLQKIYAFSYYQVYLYKKMYSDIPKQTLDLLNELTVETFYKLAATPEFKQYIFDSELKRQIKMKMEAKQNPMEYWPICYRNQVNLIKFDIWRNIKEDNCTLAMLLDILLVDGVMETYFLKNTISINPSLCMRKVLDIPKAKEMFINKMPNTEYFVDGEKIDPRRIINWQKVNIELKAVN